VEVTLADAAEGPCPSFLEEHDGGRLQRVVLDIRDEGAAARALRGHDAAVSALPYYFNFDAARLALAEGLHFADLGGNTEIVRQQQTLDDEARGRGKTLVADCGLAPGMVNILARDAIDHLSEAESVALYVGGLPRHPEPPLNYQIVYSLEGAIDYYTTESWVLRDGKPARVEALSELEPVDFPEPVGRLEAFHTAGGLSTMPWDYEGRVRSMEYKTLRYPGHVTIMKAIRELGLLATEPIDVKGAPVVPRDVFIAAADAVLRRPDSPDLVALRVVARGVRDGQPVRRSYTVLDFMDESTGISAMMRTTAYSLSVTAQMQIDGRIGPAGVHAAYEVTPAADYIQEMARRGVAIQVSED
jgi:lysine 6-dehydrogenase